MTRLLCQSHGRVLACVCMQAQISPHANCIIRAKAACHRSKIEKVDDLSSMHNQVHNQRLTWLALVGDVEELLAGSHLQPWLACIHTARVTRVYVMRKGSCHSFVLCGCCIHTQPGASMKMPICCTRSGMCKTWPSKLPDCCISPSGSTRYGIKLVFTAVVQLRHELRTRPCRPPTLLLEEQGDQLCIGMGWDSPLGGLCG